MQLQFDVSLCVRAKSKFSTCTKCMDVAPSHIQMVDNLPSFPNATGIEAAPCIGACPTEAFSLSDFSTTEFFFTFLESKVRYISPKLNVPCLSVLSVEHLIALALASDEEISLDVSTYKEGSALFEHIQATIEEANFILSSFSSRQLSSNVSTGKESDEKVQSKTQEETASRRTFLGTASLKGALAYKKTFDEAVDSDELKRFGLDAQIIAKIREKRVPDKRKILFTALKRAGVPETFEILPEEEISFVSQKFVTDACTNCQICYRICPTGALSSDAKFSLIHFDAMLCLKCRLCHDACEPDAIQLQSGFEIKEFFEPSARTLATFNIKRCMECGSSFTYKGGEQICPRCMVEEEEALFLHDNAKRMEEALKEKGKHND